MLQTHEDGEQLTAITLSLGRQLPPASPPSKDLIELPSLFELNSYQPTSIEMPPAIDELYFEDDRASDASDDEYSYRATIEEARRHYKDAKPDFCVAMQSCTTKTVVLSGSGSLADLEFETWSDKYGFWTSTDSVKDRYVVKHKGGKFFVWNGVVQGLSQEPVALVLKEAARPKNADSPVSNVESPTKRSDERQLRQRTMRQSMPYTVDKTQRKYDLRGHRLSEIELEEATWQATSPSSPWAVVDKACSKKRKLHVSRSGSCTESPPGVRSSLSSMTLVPPIPHARFPLENVMLRTRFDGFNDATILLSKDKCPTQEELFQHIKRKWAFKLEGREISYCIAAFSWLDAGKNLVLQEVDDDGFASMMEEMERVPVSQQKSRAEVVISIHAQKESVNGELRTEDGCE